MMNVSKILLVMVGLVCGPLQSYGACAGEPTGDAADIFEEIKGTVIGLTTEEMKGLGPDGSTEPANYHFEKVPARDGVGLDVHVYLPIDWRDKICPVVFSYYGGGVKTDFETGDSQEEFFHRYLAAQGAIVISLGEEDLPEPPGREPVCCVAGKPHATRLNHTNYPTQLINDIEDVLGYFKSRPFWGITIIKPESKVISWTHSFGGYTAAMLLASDRASMFDGYYLSAGYLDRKASQALSAAYLSGSTQGLFNTRNDNMFYDYDRRFPQLTDQESYFFNGDSPPLSSIISSIRAIPTMPVHLWSGAKDYVTCPPGPIFAFYNLLQAKGFNVSWSSLPMGHGPKGPEEYASYFSDLFRFIRAVTSGEKLSSPSTPVSNAYMDLCGKEREVVIRSFLSKLRGQEAAASSEIPSKLKGIFASIGNGSLREEVFTIEVDKFIEKGRFLMPELIGFSVTNDPYYASDLCPLGQNLFGKADGGPCISRLQGFMEEVHAQVKREFNTSADSYFADLKSRISQCLAAWGVFNPMLPEEDHIADVTVEYFRDQLRHMTDSSFRTLDNYLRVAQHFKCVRLPGLNFNPKYAQLWITFSPEQRRLFEDARALFDPGKFENLIEGAEQKVFEKLRGEFMAHKDVYVPRLVGILREIYAELPDKVKAKLQKDLEDHAIYLQVAHRGGFSWL